MVDAPEGAEIGERRNHPRGFQMMDGYFENTRPF